MDRLHLPILLPPPLYYWPTDPSTCGPRLHCADFSAHSLRRCCPHSSTISRNYCRCLRMQHQFYRRIPHTQNQLSVCHHCHLLPNFFTPAAVIFTPPSPILGIPLFLMPAAVSDFAGHNALITAAASFFADSVATASLLTRRSLHMRPPPTLRRRFFYAQPSSLPPSAAITADTGLPLPPDTLSIHRHILRTHANRFSAHHHCCIARHRSKSARCRHLACRYDSSACRPGHCRHL